MSRRLKLHSILCGILDCPERGKECRAYFQPPASVSMKYPAIVYALNGKDKRHADDRVYLTSTGQKEQKTTILISAKQRLRS